MANDGESKPEPGVPWFRTAAGFAQLTALLAIVGSTITGANALFTNWVQIAADERARVRETDAQEMRFQRELERDYFAQAANPDSSPETVGRVLRYLEESDYVQADMKVWAQRELEAMMKIAADQEAALREAAQKEKAEVESLREKLAALTPAATPEVRRSLEEQRARQQVRAAETEAKAIAAAHIAQPPALSEGRACASAQAIGLGVGDPPQEVVDGFCMTSASGKRFVTSDAEVTWSIRRDGKVYRCMCKL